ncbi:transglutaminase domain-containing protein [Sporosarcina sp. HYO08]|uniref:DUF4129 domain-containing transglutaminase family protein n=1 Tax=Sporosarcina sp. HYO08 TaxID=1759557 RepID=UPI000798D283|nr:transglutaminase domain-containing protein [Sporosarcina sp. HYO08]KXH78590.1 hypothetical protein AU377_12995 [Sporosarcina sp. HYO08]
MNEVRMDRRLLAFLYLLAFLLLWEWLLPVMALTDSGYLPLFLLFIVLSFVLALLRCKWWLSGCIKVIYIIWALHNTATDQLLLSTETLHHLLKDVFSNGAAIVAGDWQGITDSFRTVLFFLLLWMITYLIQHWIEVRKSILLFYVLTILFISFIDTFSAYSAEGSILRIMIVGLLLLGLLFISKFAAENEQVIPGGVFAAISLPLLFFVILGGLLSSVLPQHDPVWPDPVPYIKTMAGGTANGDQSAVSTSGYDPDDTRLGGSFTEDDTPVFQAKVDNRQYWKIETKNTYTSKGWEQEFPEDEEVFVFVPGDVMGEPIENSQNETKEAQLKMTETYPFLLYPYGMQKVFTDDPHVQFHQLQSSGHYRTMMGNEEAALTDVTIEFGEPTYSLKELRATSMKDLESLGDEFQSYLQLPDQLPDRVRELANSLTEERESVYDKAMAIERYFKRGGFVYARHDVAIPEEDEDYVDQFLFETKRGYCDNFSTSMVVLLRAAGIPARWVKGFAPGEIVKNEGGKSIYQITNNEAHSWVEAYMPNVGWMPFEPTIGFSSTADVTYDVERDANTTESNVTEQKKPEQQKKKTQTTKNESTFDLGKWMSGNKWKSVVIILAILIFGWLVYHLRRKWLPAVLVRMHRTGKLDWHAFEKQYKSLLRQLDRIGYPRAPGQTLRAYAEEIDNYFGGDQMRILTDAYEKGIYGKNIVDHNWKKLREVWEDLINRTSG